MPYVNPELDTTPWYCQFWPWFLIAIPALTVVAGIATLVLAIRSPNAMVVDDYYKAGLAINQEKHRLEQARVLNISGWMRGDSGEITVTLTGNKAQLPDTLNLKTIHATRAELDRTVILKRFDSSVYRGKWELPSTGNWYFRIQPENGDWELRSHQYIENSFQLRLANN